MFFKRDNLKRLLGIKKIKIKGVLFTIRKINIQDHVEGYKVLLRIYDDWNNKRKDKDLTENALQKTKEVYRDIFLKAVIKPALSKDGKNESIGVDELFIDWDLAHKLFNEIMSNTLGKKKTKFYT